jgi:hypothetical protein
MADTMAQGRLPVPQIHAELGTQTSSLLNLKF